MVCRLWLQEGMHRQCLKCNQCSIRKHPAFLHLKGGLRRGFEGLRSSVQVYLFHCAHAFASVPSGKSYLFLGKQSPKFWFRHGVKDPRGMGLPNICYELRDILPLCAFFCKACHVVLRILLWDTWLWFLRPRKGSCSDLKCERVSGWQICSLSDICMYSARPASVVFCSTWQNFEP